MMLMVILVSLLTDDWSAHPEIRHVTPHTLHMLQPTVHNAQCTMHEKQSAHATTHSHQYTVYNSNCILHKPQCTCTVYCTLHNPQCTVHTARHPPHRTHSVITHSIAIWSIIIPHHTLIPECDFMCTSCSHLGHRFNSPWSMRIQENTSLQKNWGMIDWDLRLENHLLLKHSNKDQNLDNSPFDPFNLKAFMNFKLLIMEFSRFSLSLWVVF